MRNPFRHLARTNVLPTPASHANIDTLELATAYYAAEARRQAVALALLANAGDPGGTVKFVDGLTMMELQLLATALAACWVAALRRDTDDVPAWLRQHAIDMENGLLS